MNIWGYDVTDKGLTKLEDTGLLKRIDKNWEKIRSKISENSSPPNLESPSLDDEYYPDGRVELIKAKLEREEKRMIKDNFSKKSNSKYNSLSNLYQKWLDGKLAESKDYIFYSGILSKGIGLRDDENFGMDLIERDRLISAYCLGKASEALRYRGGRIWRLNGFKTEIYGDMHGDLMMNQKNVQGDSLYKEIKSEDFGLLNAFYVWWMPFLSYILKYSDTIGHEISSIRQWRDLIRGADRWTGEVNRHYGINDLRNDFDNWDKQFIPQMPDKMNIMEVRKFPMGRFKSDSGYESQAIIDEKKRLIICCKAEKKPHYSEYFTLKMQNYEEYFIPQIYLEPNDINEVFLGIVSSTCKLGNMDTPNDLVAVMENWEKLCLSKINTTQKS